MAEELVPRDELRATLAARRELGEEFEPELVERFAQQLERRLAGRLEPRTTKAALTSEQRTGIAIVSMLAAIPLVAIAAGTLGFAGVAAICAALVCVNYLASR